MKPPIKGTQDIPIIVTAHIVVRISDEAALNMNEAMGKCAHQFLALLRETSWISDALAVRVDEAQIKSASGRDN